MVIFRIDDTFAVVHRNWLTENQRVKWPKSNTFAIDQCMLFDEDYIPDSVSSHGFRELYHCGKKTVLIAFVDSLMKTMNFQKQYFRSPGE